jgi:hypothetical protein
MQIRRTRRVGGVWLTALAVLAAAPLRAAQQPPTLRDVVDRFGVYLQTFERQFDSVVGEERYRQTLQLVVQNGQPAAQPVETRTLRSDYALVRADDRGEWLGFRDTFEVDGGAVRDRDDRLQHLLAGGAMTRAAQIVGENSRFNLGSEYIVRNMNVPTLVLQLLHPRTRERFAFRKHGEESLDGRGVWRLDYRERDRPTIVRSPEGRDRPARGSVWIDPDTGECWRTEIAFDDELAVVDVSFGHATGIAVMVPLLMSERYRAPAAIVTGEATYSNFRRFRTGARVIRP